MNRYFKVLFLIMFLSDCSFASEYKLKDKVSLLNERLLTQYGQKQLNDSYDELRLAETKLITIIKESEKMIKGIKK